MFEGGFCRTLVAVTDGVYDLDAITVAVEIGAHEHRSSSCGKGYGSEPSNLMEALQQPTRSN